MLGLRCFHIFFLVMPLFFYKIFCNKKDHIICDAVIISYFLYGKDGTSMSATKKVFECFGLATQEQRDKVLSQGNITNFAQPETGKVTVWFSKETNISSEGDVNVAKLGNTSRRS